MATPKLTTFKCPTCSAPLKVAVEQTDLRCSYCGSSVHVERQKPPAPGRGVPAVNTVYLDPKAGRALTWGILVVTLAPFLILGIVAMVLALGVRKKNATFPMACGTFEELTLTDRTYEGPGPLITAGTGCKVTLKNCSFKSDVIVKAEASADIRIVGSKLEGTAVALDLGHNAKLKISEKSQIKSVTTAIKAEGNVDMTIDDAIVQGGDAALRLGSSTKLTATRAQLLGKDAAVVVGSSAALTLKDSTVKAEGVAITGESNTKISAEGSTITGGDEAIHADSSLAVKLAKKSAVKATGVAIVTSSNGDFQIDDSTVDSDDTAIRATSNCKLRIVKGGRVTGKTTGFEGTSNNEFVLQSGTLESGGTAIIGTSNIGIDAKKSSIKGVPNAFLLDDRPSPFGLVDTQVVGAQVFNARSTPRPAPGTLARPGTTKANAPSGPASLTR